jgi:PKD repeat protein
VPVSFDASASSDPDGTIVSYAWDFGDGNLGGGVTAVHAYGSAGSFDVILTVTDNDTFTDTATQTIVIFAGGNIPPSAAFTAAPNPSYIGVPVTVNATNSSDTDGTLVSYAWNFGDGTIASGMVVAKLYIAKGTFPVTLTVTDDGAAWDTATLSIVIANRPPEITAVSPSLGTVRANASQAVRFTVAAIDPDFDPLTYEWRVDGAVAATAAQFDFIGQTSGFYRIAVNVSDGTDQVFREWTVTVVGGGNPPPFDLTAPWAVVLVFLLAVVAILLIASWVQRRRRRSW